MITSYLAISVIGCTVIFTYWMSLDLWGGVLRCIAFVAIMGTVHLVGYGLWKLQKAPTIAPDSVEVHDYANTWAAYGDVITAAVAQQVIILFLASMILDCGQMLRFFTVSATGAWAFNLLILIRRPRSPTQVDLHVIKYGLWLAALITMLLAPLMLRAF